MDRRLDRSHGGPARRLALALALLAPTACGGSDAKTTLDQLASWAATARLTAEARARGDVPARYAHDLLTTIAGEVTTARETLARASLDPGERARALADADSLERIVRAGAAGTDRRGDARLRVAATRLRPLASALHDLAERSASP